MTDKENVGCESASAGPERLNELILGAAGEGIYGLDCEGLTTFVNPAAVEMLGFEAEELLGQPMHALLHHSHADGSHYPREQCPIYTAFKDGEVHTVDDELFWRKDGSSFPVEYTSTPIWQDGALTGAVVVFRNLTEIKRAEAELRRALAEVEQLKDRLEQENVYLQEEIRSRDNFNEIVGDSPGIRKVIQAIETVAPTPANVVIFGETGTGKELVARALHRLSPRKDRPLVKVNCASIPKELFESEFFGHVKGAFTGAIKSRTGRFQLADGGSIFLDEVGEIPLDMQSKLLRVLQEGQFERVGGERTHRVDVRVIAATNRDLRKEAGEGRFREDLYYRLCVFPIEVPPLRSRRADVSLLAGHFLRVVSDELKLPMPRLTSAVAERLQGYDWPGNVRELRNMIERGVIVSGGGDLQLAVPAPLEGRAPAPTSTDGGEDVLSDEQMQAIERDNLLKALNRTNWRIYGPGGAAELLGLRPTTLASRLKKLGLSKPE